jgi:hypothetical protein
MGIQRAPLPDTEDPHPIYLTQLEGDTRYRQNSIAQTFPASAKSIGLSNNGINAATATTINKAGLEVQAADNSSAAYISFHRPGAYGLHMGLDIDNTFAVGGWSFGNASYKIWHGAYGTPVWQSPSDSQLKKSIRPISSALEFILASQPVSFQYNKKLRKEYFGGDNFQREKIHYGFLANDFPLQDLVAEKSGGYLGLDYQEIIPFLCRAIQEQQAQIQELEAQIQELEARINTWENHQATNLS